MGHSYLRCPTSNRDMRYTCILSVDTTPNALLYIAGCPTANALLRTAGCPTPNPLLRIAGCPVPNVLLRTSVPYSV